MLKSIFTWWNGATIGARFDIGRRAGFVGKDDQGNKYYEERKPSLEGRKRRYVIYEGYAEPSKIPPDWHGWLHHTFEKPPTEAPLPRKSWELPPQTEHDRHARSLSPARQPCRRRRTREKLW